MKRKEEKKKDVKRKKSKGFSIRFILVLLCFLLETALVILFVIALINYNYNETYYWIIPLVTLLLLDIGLGIFIVNTKVPADYKITWLAAVLILPYVGALLYLLYAHKITTKRKREIINNPLKKYLVEHKGDDKESLKRLKEIDSDAYKIANYIDHTGYVSYKNSDLTYFGVGEEGFPHILEELKKAQKFILIEYFIIEQGVMFDSIYDILKEKAQNGVRVIFIYDDFGAANKMPWKFYKKARKDGIECLRFSPLSPTMDIRQNSRDHKKIIVIDGIVGFTGGCNLADEYINVRSRFGYWKDNIVMIKGEAVTGLTTSFLISYGIITRKFIDYSSFLYENNENLLTYEKLNNDIFVQPFCDIPFDDEDIAKTVYLKLINSAKDYIYISTPYLVPDNTLVTALIDASKSGVKVVIVTPGIPDKKIAYQVTKSYYAEFLLAGIEIVQYTPGFNHEKIIIVDDKMALTGTANFDFRSLYLNIENCVFIANSPDIIKMRDSFLNMVKSGDKQVADKYVNASWFRRLYWSILRLFAPLF